jgi:hypothetical protein
MKRAVLLWIISFILTLIIAIFQRLTGPTYPISGSFELNGEVLNYKFFTSHPGEGGQEVSVVVPTNIEGKLYWKRFKTNDDWTVVSMYRNGEKLTAELPHQPPAGKLEYYITLQNSNELVKLPIEKNVVIRFAGAVPIWILIPHVIAMFGAMLLSTRTGLEYFNKEPKVKVLTLWTLGFLIAGGFILGPIMQKLAFGEFWTGFPFGIDLTDNKTLVAFIGWLGAFLLYKKTKKPELWALLAALLLIVTYLIPHSVLGSELDYNELDKQKLEILNSK